MAINMAAYVRGVESLMCCARARYFLRRLQRYVHGVEREVEEERLRPVSLDELHRTIRERLGEVRCFAHDLVAVVDGRGIRADVDVRMPAGEEP